MAHATPHHALGRMRDRHMELDIQIHCTSCVLFWNMMIKKKESSFYKIHIYILCYQKRDLCHYMCSFLFFLFCFLNKSRFYREYVSTAHSPVSGMQFSGKSFVEEERSSVKSMHTDHDE